MRVSSTVLSHPLEATSAVELAAAPDLSEGSVYPALDGLYIRHERRWLLAILAAYLIAGLWYALVTPAWQTPDEPAHYNYVAELATTGALPVLRMGDYDQHYLEKLLATHFAPMFPTAPLRYESYQPPLYYLLAVPVYWLGAGDPILLRLFSVVLSAGSLLLLYRCLQLVFPGKPLISLGAAAFAGLLPMHVAMSASINNDVLAELLLLAALLVLLTWMRDRFAEDSAPTAAQERRRFLLLGLLLGLGLLTKIYAYLMLPLCLLAVLLIGRQTAAGNSHSLRRTMIGAGWIALPAFLIGLPLWLRNRFLYGGWDLLALRWHDQVVVGQPRTPEWIAQHGWVAYGERAFSYTFRSFWGVFGWMGVFMDERIYTALSIFTGVLFLGLLWASVRMISGPPDTDMNRFQMYVLALFALFLAVVLLSYTWYNLKFVQHQGRYFFWGLLPISTLVALGWREVLHPLQGLITGLMAAVLAGALAFTGYLSGSLDEWTVAIIALVALLLVLQPLLLAGAGVRPPRRLPARIKTFVEQGTVQTGFALLRSLVWVLPFLLLFLLNLLVPFWFIVPQLAL